MSDKFDGYNYSLMDFNRDQMLMDILLRITAVENLLLNKNIITEEEIKEELQYLSIEIAKTAAQKITKQLGPEGVAELESIIATNSKNKKSN